MYKYTDGNNIVDFIIFVEFNKYMAFMTIDYQYSIHTSKTTLYIFIKILNSV